MSRQLSLLAQLARAETIAERFVRMQRYEQQAYRDGVSAIAGVDMHNLHKSIHNYPLFSS